MYRCHVIRAHDNYKRGISCIRTSFFVSNQQAGRKENAGSECSQRRRRAEWSSCSCNGTAFFATAALPSASSPGCLSACLSLSLCHSVAGVAKERGRKRRAEGGPHKKLTRRLFAPPALLPGVAVTLRRYFARFCRGCPLPGNLPSLASASASTREARQFFAPVYKCMYTASHLPSYILCTS